MSKLIWAQSPLFIAATLLLSVSLPVASAPVQTIKRSHDANLYPNTWQQKIPNPFTRTEREAGTRLLEFFRRRGRDAATRGGRFCPISPSNGSRITWDPRPAFVWQGDVTRIQVERSGGETLWEQKIESGQQQLLYPQVQEALEAGQTYYVVMEYLVFKDDGTLLRDGDGNPVSKITRFPIEVLDDETLRWEIAKQLGDSMSFTQEEQALYRAKYFATQSLFLDVVRELVSVPQPSAGWKRKTTDLKKAFCDS